MRFTLNRSASLALLGTLASSQLACSAIVSPDPSRLGVDQDASGPALDAFARDAFVPEGTDANFPDAFAVTPDAYVPPGVDAFSPDAFVAIPDAFIPDTGCVAGSDRCTGSALTRCVDGSVVATTCALGCAEGVARCREMVPSNVDPALLSEGTMDIVLTSAMLNTSMCPRVLTQLGGGEACLFVGRNVSVPAGTTVRVTGPLPVIILASGTVTIAGVLDLSAEGVTPGAGGYRGGPVTGDASLRGPQRGTNGAFSGTFLDSGGGGGAHCGNGGAGGNANAVVGGAGGMGMMTTLQPLTAGSGGGFGQGGNHTRADDLTPGGAGGGAIQISSAVSITVTGRIDVGGGAGQGGRNNSNWGAGGGGGAGGGILLEAPVLTLEDSAELLATGGGGGAGRDGTSAPPGEDGRTLDDQAAGGNGSGRYGADGGDSGGGAISNGEPGDANTGGDGNGGGGGGGVGCIVLRALAPARPSSGVSPSGTGLQSLPLMVR